MNEYNFCKDEYIGLQNPVFNFTIDCDDKFAEIPNILFFIVSKTMECSSLSPPSLPQHNFFSHSDAGFIKFSPNL
jgi:hypothetical protein